MWWKRKARLQHLKPNPVPNIRQDFDHWVEVASELGPELKKLLKDPREENVEEWACATLDAMFNEEIINRDVPEALRTEALFRQYAARKAVRQYLTSRLQIFVPYALFLPPKERSKLRKELEELSQSIGRIKFKPESTDTIPHPE